MKEKEREKKEKEDEEKENEEKKQEKQEKEDNMIRYSKNQKGKGEKWIQAKTEIKCGRGDDARVGYLAADEDVKRKRKSRLQ